MVAVPLFIFCCFCFSCDIVVSSKIQLILEAETMEYENTVMECKFDLGGSTLGSVSWDKDRKTFFRYTRTRIPHTEVFPVAGISLDAEKSNVSHVFLTNLKPESSGQYSCTVENSGGGRFYILSFGNMTTHVREPTPLLVTTRKSFFTITTHNYSAAIDNNDDSYPDLSDGRQYSSKSYHYTKGTLYTGSRTILNWHFIIPNNTLLPFLESALILAEEGLVTSMTVDWLHNTLYLTDDLLDSIVKINLTSERRETLLDSTQGVTNPESIVVDPFQGYLFWGDNNDVDKKIVSSALDGRTNRQTIVSSDLTRAILALDLDRRRLFFISSEGLSSCKYDGSDRRVDFRHRMLDSNVNSLSYYDQFIYWSRYASGKSSSGLFYARITSTEVTVKELPIKFILDVKVFHPNMQRPSLQYSCALLECSDGCATDASGSAQCTCPAGYSLTAGATVCTKEFTDKDCEKSQTIVNSEPRCKGELVFEENFDSSTLDHSKWQNTVRISSDHEIEFVVFDKDKKNIYIKDGNLVIKPTSIDDDTISLGNISLLGCTSPVAHLCEKRAVSYSIIPPVQSALINTAHAFNFRYGHVSVRAKLPRGDWIYPVLNLQATKDFYSPDYRSGVMRVADVRGNQQLTCEGQEGGGKNLMSGVVVGPQLNIKKHFINRLADKEWTDDFHIFKFTWTPDELSFSVDDQPRENILPEGKTLSEVLGLPNENGSRLDPLNRDMYLSVGVGVGGALEFPDHCISGSGHNSATEAKPWRNYEVKSMLKFWQKKSSWYPTWGEHSALLVDYISIQAL